MDGDEADSVAEAVERTADTGIAKVSLESVSDTAATLEAPDPHSARRPGLLGFLRHVPFKGFELFTKYLLKLAAQGGPAEGFLDFQARRCAVDYGAFAELIHGSSEWSGRSGRAIATLPEKPVRALSPLWLFDLLRGVTDAAEVDSERVRGRRCRRLRATSDLARVAGATADKTPLPPGAWFEELGALPLDLWLDEEGYVRRIGFQHRLIGAASQPESTV